MTPDLKQCKHDPHIRSHSNLYLIDLNEEFAFGSLILDTSLHNTSEPPPTSEHTYVSQTSK